MKTKLRRQDSKVPEERKLRKKVIRRGSLKVIAFPDVRSRNEVPLYEQSDSQRLGWVSGYYAAEPGGGGNCHLTLEILFHSDDPDYMAAVFDGMSFRNSCTAATPELEERQSDMLRRRSFAFLGNSRTANKNSSRKCKSLR